LMARGAAHFKKMDQAVLRQAAEMVADDRARSGERHWRPLPGQAEYIDLLRVVHHRANETPEGPAEILKRVRPFLLLKHPDASPE